MACNVVFEVRNLFRYLESIMYDE